MATQITPDAVKIERGDSLNLARIETTTTTLEAPDRNLPLGVKENAYRER